MKKREQHGILQEMSLGGLNSGRTRMLEQWKNWLRLDGQEKGSGQQSGMAGFPHESINTCFHSQFTASEQKHLDQIFGLVP